MSLIFTKISQQIPIWDRRKTIYMLTYICIFQWSF